MPEQPTTRTRPAPREAGRPRARDGAVRLDASSPFVIALRELGRRPGAAQPVHRTGELPDRLGLEMIAIEAGTPIDADLLLQSASEGVLVTGTVRAAAAGECGRCLGPVATTISADVMELFAYPSSLTEQTSDEDEIYRVGATRDGTEALDVEPVVRDALVLALPLTPLCREDCAGLCVDCGQPLAELPADHHHDLPDPRWAALAAFAGEPGDDGEPSRTQNPDPYRTEE